MSISSDLSFGGNNAIALRSLRMTEQSSPISGALDLACIYASGVDLYYNDGNGNQIRITQSGGVAGTSGSIANLTSPASATYVSATPAFVWQSAANTAANLDAGSLTIRKLTASSPGITIAAPSGLGSSYTLSLPSALPASQNLMTVDNSGNVGVATNVDNSTLQLSSNILSVKDAGITPAKLGAASYASAPFDSGSSTSSSTSYTAISGQTVTLTCTGLRPVLLTFVGFTGGAYVSASSAGYFSIFRNGSGLTNMAVGAIPTSPSILTFMDLTPPAGSNTYALQYKTSGTGIVSCIGVIMQAAEL
jgi:hypothetical protein